MKKCKRDRKVPNDEFERIAEYLKSNELLINLKKGKTESLLFGTAKRLSNVTKPFAVMFNSHTINNVAEYKYLKNVVDASLSLSNDFGKKYRKASNPVQLLQTYLTKSASLII